MPRPPEPSLEVEHYLRAVPEELSALVSELRAMVLEEAPGVEESVLWRSLSYHKADEGGRVKGAVCQIELRAGGVRLGFIHGASLPDPVGLLQGSGKAKRFVPLDADRMPWSADLRELVHAAVAHRPGDAG